MLLLNKSYFIVFSNKLYDKEMVLIFERRIIGLFSSSLLAVNRLSVPALSKNLASNELPITPSGDLDIKR